LRDPVAGRREESFRTVASRPGETDPALWGGHPRPWKSRHRVHACRCGREDSAITGNEQRAGFPLAATAGLVRIDLRYRPFAQYSAQRSMAIFSAATILPPPVPADKLSRRYNTAPPMDRKMSIREPPEPGPLTGDRLAQGRQSSGRSAARAVRVSRVSSVSSSLKHDGTLYLGAFKAFPCRFQFLAAICPVHDAFAFSSTISGRCLGNEGSCRRFFSVA